MNDFDITAYVVTCDNCGETSHVNFLSGCEEFCEECGDILEPPVAYGDLVGCEACGWFDSKENGYYVGQECPNDDCDECNTLIGA